MFYSLLFPKARQLKISAVNEIEMDTRYVHCPKSPLEKLKTTGDKTKGKPPCHEWFAKELQQL